MDMKKELEDFGIRFAGAILGESEAAATEIYNRVTGYNWGQISPNLAMNDNLIVAGLAIPPWVIGYLVEEEAEKKGDSKAKAAGEALRKVGEGDVIFTWTQALHHTLIRNIPQTFPIQARVGQPSQPPAGRPGGGSPASVVVKL